MKEEILNAEAQRRREERRAYGREYYRRDPERQKRATLKWRSKPKVKAKRAAAARDERRRNPEAPRSRWRRWAATTNGRSYRRKYRRSRQ